MRLILAFLLLLAACGPAGEEPVANEGEPAAAEANQAEPEAAAVPSLEGEWTITRINRAAPDQVWPMNVAVTADRFTILSDCVRMAWDYIQDRNIVRFTPQPVDSCGRTRSPAELIVEQPIELANIAMFSNEGGEVQLSGPGGSVTMVRR